MENNPLAHLQEKAVRAHNNTSFSPERRGEQMIKDYGEELAADIAELEAAEIPAEAVADYKARYERFFNSYLHAKSNTFSAMITGPANFPVRRHEKANRSEQKHYEVFREWRDRAKKSIVRKAQPPKTFTSELERYRSQLASMKENHDKMKAGNKRIAAAKKSGEDLTDYLISEFGVSPHMVQWTSKWGFNLANNNANMKRVEWRIKELEAKEKKQAESPITNYTFDGGTFCVNYDIDRIQIFFTVKPTKAELWVWKPKGLNTFNWSPSNNAWQRKITSNAMRTVNSMLPDIKKV